MDSEPLSSKLASLCLISQCKLESILTLCGDKKDLIIDSTLIKPLERVCGVNWLRKNGIDKIFKVDPKLQCTMNKIRVYFIPACINTYRCVLDQISSVISQNPDYAIQNCFHIIIVPKFLSTYDIILESRGLYGIVKLHSFTWELMMIDDQLLSLELPFLFKQLYVEHNHSLLSSVSMSLWSLLHVTGKPKTIFSIGKLSSSVLDILDLYNETYSRDFVSKTSSNEIGALIVVDRNQDYSSSLLTPATYSGLLSELFKINCGYLELNVKNTKLKQGQVDFCSCDEKPADSKNAVMLLDSTTDKLYAEIKHRHFSEVLTALSSKAKMLKNKDIQALGIEEMKDFVSNQLQEITLYKQHLVNHVLACETIISEMSSKYESLKLTETEMLNNKNKKANFQFIDENFSTEIHRYNSLRLMCLLSLTQQLTYEEYNVLVTKYLQAFGYQYLYVFNNLVHAGLLNQPTTPKMGINMTNFTSLSDKLPKWQNEFQCLANKLKLLPSNQSKSMANSPCYVYNGGYMPLVAVLCEVFLTSNTLSEVLIKLNALPELKVGGKIQEILKIETDTWNDKCRTTQHGLDFGCKDSKALSKLLKTDPNVGNCFPLKPKSVLIYVIGGVNYAEIGACDYIQCKTGGKIYVASDCVHSGDDMIKAAF